MIAENPHFVRGRNEHSEHQALPALKVSEPAQSVAELTNFSWIIMSPGKEPLDLANLLRMRTSHLDYKELCCLDVLDFSATPSNGEVSVYAEFKEQLVWDKDGWYETGLPWRGDHPVLPNNKEGSLCWLGSLNKRVGHQNLTCEYGEVIEDQKKVGVVQRADEPVVQATTEYTYTITSI